MGPVSLPGQSRCCHHLVGTSLGLLLLGVSLERTRDKNPGKRERLEKGGKRAPLEKEKKTPLENVNAGKGHLWKKGEKRTPRKRHTWERSPLVKEGKGTLGKGANGHSGKGGEGQPFPPLLSRRAAKLPLHHSPAEHSNLWNSAKQDNWRITEHLGAEGSSGTAPAQGRGTGKSLHN